MSSSASIRSFEIPTAMSKIALIAISFVCIVLSGFVRIPLPFTPVPATLQTFFIILSAAAIGGRLAGLPAALMIVAGLGGLPVFSTVTPGFLYLLGPTGGYFAGFVLASVLVGWGVRFARTSFLKMLALCLCAVVCVLACGMSWLVVGHKFSVQSAFFAGAAPFVVSDMVKAVLAAAVFMKIQSRLARL